MNHSKALTVIRAARGIQQKELAELLDVTPSYISRIENGERPMSKKMVEKLSERLSIPVELFNLLAHDASSLKKQDKKVIDLLSRELLDLLTRD